MSKYKIAGLWINIILVLALFQFAVITPAEATNDIFGNLGDTPEEQLAEIRGVVSSNSLKPGNVYDAALIVNIKENWHINSIKPFQDWLIPAELRIDTTNELTPSNIIFPDAATIFLLGENMSVYHDSIIVRFRLKVSNKAPAGDYFLPVSFTYQACNDKECRAPMTLTDEIAITIGAEGQPINQEIFASNAVAGENENQSAANAEPQSDLEQLIEKHGFWGYFLALGLAFITGLLLSFSPCTYPMIPITVSIFAGQDRSLGRGFILSLFYVGSMAVMYGIMGLIVSLVGGVFGAWLASPAVVIGIAVVFVIFALSMFGLYELQVPYSLRQKLGAKQTGGGVGGSIVLGIVAALVVSPCVGPFVAGILLYIATYGSPIFGFITLFIFAVGLGTLYILIGTFSSAISALPGAGTWMETVKGFFGFVLLFMALYFLRTVISPVLYSVTAALLLIAFAVFGGAFDRLTSEDGLFPRLKKYLGLLALLVGAYLLLATMLSGRFLLPEGARIFPSGIVTQSGTEEKLIPWKTELESGLAEAGAQGKPVLIDTWATWCVNCRVLEKKTFGNADVAAEARRFYPLKIQLEKAGSPETKDFMERFGMKHYSLPTTLLLDSKGEVKKIMQGVVDPDEMIAEMQKVR
ncbi:MAG: cytochrome c biogenesis protein CcdA [Candidatus Zixiibacteriota bacterium]